MPFLTSFAELKDMASNNLNIFNVFSEPSSINEKQNRGTDTPTSTAIAGPGPSTQAISQQRASTLIIPTNGSRPIRPSLRASDSSSPSSSSDESGTRRSSGASVVIVDPIDGTARRSRLGENDEAGRARLRSRSKSLSAPSLPKGEMRRRKKAQLDTYIIVRPPPTSAKNPLNLQIQLVVKEPRMGERSMSGISLRSASTSTDTSSPSSVPSTPPSPEHERSSAPTLPTMETPSTELTHQAESPSPVPLTATGDVGAGIRRSNSLKSNISSNTSSTGFSSGYKKRVEPMFNLAVHNVVHSTVVTDASTDARVAKFVKRGLEVNGVGLLEPSEVWVPLSNVNSAANLAVTGLADEHPSLNRSRPHSLVSLTTPLSPTSTSDHGPISAIRDSLDSSMRKTSLDLKTFRQEVVQDGGGRKFFGKIFKKKQIGAQANALERPRSKSIVLKRSNSPPDSNTDPHATPTGILKQSHNPSVTESNHQPRGQPTFGTTPVIVQRRSSGTIVTFDGAVTGLTASSASPLITGPGSWPDGSDPDEKCMPLPVMPSNRPVGYTWSVKKWSKKNSEGWASHLVAAASIGLDLVNGFKPDEGDDEVLFEWVKLRVPSNAAGTSIMRQLSTTGVITAPSKPSKSREARLRTDATRDQALGLDPSTPRQSMSMGQDGLPASIPSSPAPSPRLDPRPQPVRRVSESASPARSQSCPSASLEENEKDHDASSIQTLDMTAEEDSDPEDSETPWTCSIWVKKTGQRQLLGTLTPAPHHPKVIAALKIPISLDKVLLTDIKVSSSVTGAQTEMAKKVREEICLTEENLKDVICVTAMWLVAREEFGGLGRKKRGSKP